MELVIQLIPVKAGTSDPVGEYAFVPCPQDVEPDTVLSFLTQQFGDFMDTAWTYTPKHPRVELGWVFPGSAMASVGRDTLPNSEVIAIPMISDTEGTLTSMFEVQADMRLEFEQLAASGKLESVEVIPAELRDYVPAPPAQQPDES